MRAVEASEVNEHEQAGVERVLPVMSDDSDAGVPLGRRLALARATRGWSQSDVAARMKLPAKLIARLENDDYEGLTQGVFLRGYLAGYARLVDVPVDAAVSVAVAHSQAAPLVATGTISRSRYLFERYSVSATYLVLTAIIVVPAVWLATHGGLEQNLARTTPLDPPANVAAASARDTAVADNAAEALANATSTASTTVPAPVANTQPATATPPAAANPPPVIASMTPFTAAPSEPAPAPSTSSPAAASLGSGAHALSLKLSQQSWVEITATDGRKLEYGMLAAGSEHSYRSDGPISIRLGNAQGAEVRSDGSLVDLTPFQRGNVAHLKLFGEGGPSAARSDQ